MVRPGTKIFMGQGDKVNSNNKLDLGSDFYFNKVINDTIVQLNADIRKNLKKLKWYYLPTKEHLDCLLEKISYQVEYEIYDDYVRLRLLKGRNKNGNQK